jgi:DNA-binding response OmpR family regulator
MSDVGIVVCERRKVWAVALRRESARSDLRIVETRTLDDCRQEAQHAPSALVVCEATRDRLEAVLRFLVEWQTQPAAPPVAVVGERSMRRHAAALREAGAVHVMFSPRQLAGVVRMATRHAARRPAADERSLTQLAWSRLPWQSTTRSNH